MEQPRNGDAILNELKTCEQFVEKVRLFAELTQAPDLRVEHILGSLDSVEFVARQAGLCLHHVLETPLVHDRACIDRAFWEQELASRGISLGTDWRSLDGYRKPQ